MEEGSLACRSLNTQGKGAKGRLLLKLLCSPMTLIEKVRGKFNVGQRQA